MIALRGILRQNEEKKWIWKGVWTFGELPHDEQAALSAKNPSVRPFSYAWEESRKAGNELVPSANINSGNEENKEESSKEDAKKENDDAKVAAPDTTIENTTTPKPAQAENTSKESAPSQDVEMTDAKDTSDGEVKKADETTTSGGVEPMEVDKATESKKLESTAAEAKPATESTGADNPAKEQKQDSTISKEESSKRTVAFENQDNKPKKDQVTFASTLPGEPPFTDADIKHPDKCPPGGAWKGYFETATVSQSIWCF